VRGAARALHAAGHAAVWPGLYAAGLYWMLALAVDAAAGVRAGLFVFLVAQAGYLLDRVKLSAWRMDPADAAAQPDRQRVLGTWQGVVRGFIVVELAAASVIGLTVDAWLAGVPAVGATAVVWYAGRPAGGAARPKDRLWTKGLLVATAHIALAALVLRLDAGPAHSGPVWIAGCAAAWWLVLGDSVACDLDDLEADRAFGTRTVPAAAGRRAAWGLITLCYGVCAAMVLGAAGGPGSRLFAAGVVLTGLTAGALSRRRDFIDARLIVLAAAWWVGG
jgi:4-hydroxybenzoate polyprenyltransferase